MKKVKLFALFAAILFATNMWAADPWGSIDGLQGKNGSLRVWGWSLDPDDGSKTVEVHVYIFSSSTEDDLGKAVKGIPGTYANISRPDLESMGYGTMHGFDRTIDISDLSAGTYYVQIYALNVAGTGTNPRLPYSGNGGYKKSVTINAPYTVSYNANGGSGAPGSQKKAQDVNLTLQGKGSLARTGYTTDGWATSSTGSKVYNFGATYSENTSRTLYAHWNIVTYTIGYTLNGGSVTGNPTSYNVTTNTFTLNNPQKTGYTFAGWTGSNGTTKQTTVQIAKGSTGNKSYTANWTPINYTITYDLAGGTATNPANYTIETNTFMLVAPTRSGYIFTGWTGSNGNTPQTSVSIAKGSTGDKSYTANWRSEKQTGSWTYVAYKTGRTNTPNNNSQAISYNGFNGKLGSWGNVSFINAGDKGIGCQATGNGRANEKKGIYSIYKNEQTIPSYAKRRLTATLTVSSSCAKYNTTAALYAHTNQTELQAWNVDFTHGMANSTGSSKRITYLVNSTKNGSWQSQSANYTFDFDNSNGSADATKGWYILLTEVICTYTAYDSGVSEKAVFNSSDENFDTWFYYKHVTFNGNGATSGMMDLQKVENSASLTANGFVRTGYTFAGWNTAADGTGTAYDDEATMTATSTDKGPVTLYAQWMPNNYTVTLDQQSGTGGSASVQATYAAAMPSATMPTREGHTFGGYYTAVHGGGTQYYHADGTSAKNFDHTDDMTLHALWTVNQYTITFNTDGGSLEEPITQDYGSAITVPNDPMRTGYIFTGWQPEIPTTMPAHDMTVVAQWTESTEPVTETIYSGFTATDGNGGFNGEEPSKLVDGLFVPGLEGINWTKWCTRDDMKSVPTGESEACWWVDFHSETPITVTGYILTTGNDNVAYGAGRNPNTWVLQAKLHPSDPWKSIAAVTNDTKMQVADFTDFAFDLDIPGTYKYFRYKVLAPKDGNLMQLCELRLTKHSTYNPEATTDEILAELYEALGNDVWTGYGEQTGVISYSRGSAENTFGASFMGGTYSFDLPFEAFTAANKHDNGDGTFTYNLSVNLPALTGMSHETLQVTMDSNGNITGIHSDNAAIEMTQESGVGSWAQLQAAMAAGGVIKLTQHVTAPVNATALYVPTDKTVMLDLNDFTIDRALTDAVADGSVIVNNGTLAIMGEGQITGGNTTGNGGGILNNGTFTLYGGEITGNHAHMGAGVYNNKVNTATEGFWMTGGLIHNNTADTYPAIKGDVAFNNMALVQIDADGTTVSVATAKTGMSHYGYVKPVMPDGSLFAILSELYAILGNDVWTGYGAQTGVISYCRGEKENEFRASFMGGTYAFDLPFADFTAASKTENTDGSVTYNLTVLLPPQAGMPQETLEVTIKDGEIKAIHSDNAQIDMVKAGGEITSWDELRAAMAEGGVIKLSQSITAPANAEALMVPTDKTVVLDLNGFTVDRALTSAVENGSVIINEGVLAIMDELGTGVITGGNTTGNGGGIFNNGTFTLYGGEITGNHAHVGAGVCNNKVNTATEGFWMTGGLIHNNTADTYPAIKGDVAFNAMAVVQINESGTVISAETAKAGLATNGYIRPVMPNGEMLAILSELYNALGTDVWTGYGEQTGVISYSRVEGVNEFHASFMGGTYAFDLPFGDFTAASKTDNADGSVTYNLTVLLPAQTGMPQETLEVTIKDGEIKAIHSDNAGIEMMKEGGAITSWEELQAAMNAGGVIKLTQDITATANAEALNVPLDKTVVLDLNGFAVNRALTSAVLNGSVIINDGTLAIMDETGHGTITGGNTTGNGGGILNNGTLTLYGGEITGNKAANGGAVYNDGGEQGFWMTGGLIDGNAATTYPSISGEVIFNSMAVVEIAANGATVSISTAKSHMGSLTYVKPVMPNMNMFAILAELYAALGDDVWTGYGANTGVISYSHGIEPNTFRASFMGGTYAFDLPFGDFSAAEKVDNGDGTYTYNLTALLPVETGMSSETLHVTVNSNGEITGIHSDNAQIDMVKEGGEITSWEELQAAMNAGGVITLTQDITAPANAEALTVPEDKTVVIELDGNTIDRALTSAVENGSVIINNGVLAIMDEAGNGSITGGKTTGNGGGVLNNGTFTLYSGEITGNTAVEGGGVYNSVANTETTGFWMTGGLIHGNTATSNPAIGGAVIFNEMAEVQVDADGTQVTIEQALANMASYNYVKPVMPSYDEIENDYTLLTELYNALGNDVWTGYGAQTGVISYKHGSTQNTFNASFMGGTYSFDLPFEAFEAVSKTDNGDGTFTYNLTVNLPAETGLAQETLHVTLKNGEITELESENVNIEMQKEEAPVTGWAALQAAMTNGGVIKLGENVTAESTDLALTVPAGKTVVLELNGFTIDRALTSAVENGSVIVNNGTLAIMGEGQIKGGKTTGNGGGILNNGTLTLYGGEITGNHAHVGAGVYNNKVNTATEGFWMTGGLIYGNTADSYAAIKGDVTFNSMAVVQIDAQGTTISIATAIANMASLNYVKPVMPDMTKFALLTELYNALGTDVWTGYGATTGVISYSQGSVANTFNATFMGGTYSLDIPFADFASVEKVDNGNGTFTYNLVVNLPAQTGMAQETLHVTMNSNGEITELESENAGIEMQKEEGPVTGWAALQAAMTQGGVIKLGENVTAESTDLALTVPEGKTVVLELNGFTIDRALTSAVENGSVIVNNGTLAIMGEGQIKGGKTTGNGGGILNNGTLTLYGGEITDNHAALGGGVYNNVTNSETLGFWMTGGLIYGNTATSNPAIGGDVIFNDLAVVQVDAQGTKVSIANALANMATYDYIQPAMPDMEDMTKNTLLLELYNALGDDVWTGYGAQTGVISYKQGTEPNSFNASFMGGTYSFDLPFEAFESVSKADNGDGTYTYSLTVNLPAQTGLSQETLHVTMNNQGEITELESENVEIDMNKEEAPVTGWAALQAAMNNGGIIKLGENVTAESTDLALTVPEGKTVVLELNGFNINRALTSAVENGSVIVNNGTLAIMGEGQIKGGKTTGNGGGILNNGTLTLYGGEITGNVAALGGGVYNNGGEQGFWMTGGLIDGNTASSYPAIGGEVIFNAMAAVQIDADGTQVTIEQALADLATYSYIKPVMPNYEDIPTGEAIIANKDPQNDGTFYSTFYDSANNYILPEGVAAYVADLSGSDLVLTRIAMAGQVIPADNAVILVSSVANYSITKTNAVPVTFTANNDLEGVDEATPLTDIPGLTAQNCYVLSGTTQYGVGFYRINVGTLKAHKAFVQYTGNQNNAPRRMRFVFSQATGMEDVQEYNAQSIKVIENGVLYIIKNGVRYNVQGQIVK